MQDTVQSWRYVQSRFTFVPSDARGCHSFKNLTSRHPVSLLKFVSLGTLLARCTLFRQRRSPSSSNTFSMTVSDPTMHQGKTSTNGPPSQGSAVTGVSQLSRSQTFGRQCRWTTRNLLSPALSAHGAPCLISIFRAIGH